MRVEKLLSNSAINQSRNIVKNLPAKNNYDSTTINLSTIGKHKIPRYLYHITSKEKYNKMMTKGFIIPDNKDSLIQTAAIYFTDIENLTKRWSRTKDKSGDNILQSLLEHCIDAKPNKTGTNNKDIVILRIPTSKLKKQDLRIRSQNRFMSKLEDVIRSVWGLGDELRMKTKADLYSKFSPEDAMKKSRKDALNIKLNKSNVKDILYHLYMGDNAKYSNLYKQRKEAIEYFYPDKINMKDVEKLGEAHLPDKFEKIAGKTKDIFMQLFKSTNEQKAVKHWFNPEI